MKPIWLVCFLFFRPALSFSQTNDPGLAFLEWSFVNPGARAAGMGGSFLALADDTTASVANPAGLTILTRKEASIEFTQTSFSNDIGWNTGTRTESQNRRI